jgi:hypothetical protein
MWAIKQCDNQLSVLEYASAHHEGLNLLIILKCGGNDYSAINFLFEFHIKVQNTFEIHKAVNIKSLVLWVVSPCSVVHR